MNDPILTALLQKQLDHIAQQMGWVMQRTARSPIFSDSHDFSCFIADARGRVVSVADGIPIHTGGGGFAVAAVLSAFAGDLHAGDVFILSDPYEAGGNHLPDWTLVRPVFHTGRLMAFACNRAHQSDIGGGAAGTYNAEATEIFHEGIRLPVLKLIERGNTRADVWRLLALNSRCPDLIDGDLRAMVGSTLIGERRLLALMAEHGAARAEAGCAAILDHAERMMRAAIAAVPDGAYCGEDVSDNDCFSRVPVAVRATLRVSGGEVEVDFTGSAPQTRGFKNSSLANTHAATYMALLAFLGDGLPRNEGSFRPIRIVAPPGTVVNALPPAAMTLNTIHPAHEIIHAIWQALGVALPARACAGWGKIGHCISSGRTDRGSTWVMYHMLAYPAAGAAQGRDGFNTLGSLITLGGMTLPNVETFERKYPVAIKRQEFRCDGGGPGEFRGGTGVEYEVEVRAPAEHSFRGEAIFTATGFGVVGGAAGARADLSVETLDGAPVEVPQYGVRQLPPVRLRMRSSGGGGWGDPKRRPRASVLRDLEDGVVSARAAESVYGLAADDAAPPAERGPE